MPEPIDVYNKLFGHFGPQGWWPVTKKGECIPGYFALRYVRKSEREKCEICLGALLTQNTAWKNAEKALSHLHRAGVVSIEKIHAIPARRLEAYIRSSGYYRQKAIRLKEFAGHIFSRHRGRLGNLFAQPLSSARQELISIKGIGPETADSMLLYAGGKPVSVIDAYTYRIGERLGWPVQREYAAAQRFFHRALPVSAAIYNEFHALLVALGKTVCAKVPRCMECPLNEECLYGRR